MNGLARQAYTADAAATARPCESAGALKGLGPTTAISEGGSRVRKLATLAGAILLATALIPFSVSSPAVAATPFTDIADSPFKADIDWLYNQGVTTGCTATKYCPKDAVTREQMASFLVRMFKLPGTVNDYFTDDEASMHESNVNRLAASGITSGCDTAKFCPKALVTREQMASFISRAVGLSVGAGRNYFYDDNASIHEDNIDRSAAAGIASGCGTWRYCPRNTVSREQMAAFLHRIVSPVAAPAYPAPPPPTATPKPTPAPTPKPACDPSYPGVCIPPPPPDLNCPDVPYENFTVLAPDPHGFDGNNNGIGCES